MFNQVVHRMLKRACLRLFQVVDSDHGVLTVVIGLESRHAGGAPLPFPHPTGRGWGFATASTPAVTSTFVVNAANGKRV